jgi:ABC-2 type transport system permease protein
MRGIFPNAWHIARREYQTRVRTRTYVISTILLMVVAAGVVLLPTFIDALGLGDPPTIAVSIEADDVSTDPILTLEAMLAGTSQETDGPQATVRETDDPDAAAQEVRDDEIDGLLTIRRDGGGELAFEYLTEAGPGSQTRQLVAQAAQALATQDRLARAGLSPEERADISTPVAFETVAADPNARDEDEFGPALLFAWALVILTFMAVLTYGQWVAQSVAEEKSNRVMELLITAATPRQLLTGKVLGTAAAGLTQYVAVIGAVAVAFILSGPLGESFGLAGEGPSLPAITPMMALAFAGFFFGGFLLYATLYAATGSMVSRLEEVQQAAGPLTVIAMLGYFVTTVAINIPDVEWVVVLSLVPFFSPYLMPARMLLTNVTALEVLIALVLIALSFAAAVWIAARIYSAGVLLYGQRPGWRQVLRATRMAR